MIIKLFVLQGLLTKITIFLPFPPKIYYFPAIFIFECHYASFKYRLLSCKVLSAFTCLVSFRLPSLFLNHLNIFFDPLITPAPPLLWCSKKWTKRAVESLLHIYFHLTLFIPILHYYSGGIHWKWKPDYIAGKCDYVSSFLCFVQLLQNEINIFEGINCTITTVAKRIL